MPPHRIVGAHRIVGKGRTTFYQRPESLDFWTKTTTSYVNLFMDGDWTNTSLPATIEGAVRSGFNAAKTVE